MTCGCITFATTPAGDNDGDNKQDPYTTFVRAMRILRVAFQAVSQDIFSLNYGPSRLMYAITVLWVFAIICYTITTFDTYYDTAIRFTTASLMFGAPQVSHC